MAKPIGIWTAAELLAETVELAISESRGIKSQSAPMLAAFEILPLAAAERRCSVVGRRGRNGMWEPIPAHLWFSLTIDPIAAKSDDNAECSEAQAHPTKLGPDYYENVWNDLRWNRAEIEALRTCFKTWYEAGRPPALPNAQSGPAECVPCKEEASDWVSYPEAIKTAGKALFGAKWVGPTSAHENVLQKLGPAHPDWMGMVPREHLRNAQSSEVDAWLYKRGLVEETKTAGRIVRAGALGKALADELDIPASGDGANWDTEPYWTLAETVLWILTRDASRVAAVPRPAVDGGLPRDSAVMEELLRLAAAAPELVSGPEMTHPDLWEELPNGGGFLIHGEVFEDLARRVRAGEVMARGQRPGLGDSEAEPISPSRWDTLVFQSMPDGLCGAFGKKTLWVRVQFRQREVTAWWPPKGELAPRSRQGTFSFGEIADEVARLNAGTTREAVLTRLEKSFEEGEFERDGE